MVHGCCKIPIDRCIIGIYGVGFARYEMAGICHRLFATLLSLGLGLAMLKDTEKTKNKGGFDYADCRMVIYSICSFCNSCIYLEPNR